MPLAAGALHPFTGWLLSLMIDDLSMEPDVKLLPMLNLPRSFWCPLVSSD
jgi:hypothetical protein